MLGAQHGKILMETNILIDAVPLAIAQLSHDDTVTQCDRLCAASAIACGKIRCSSN